MPEGEDGGWRDTVAGDDAWVADVFKAKRAAEQADKCACERRNEGEEHALFCSECRGCGHKVIVVAGLRFRAGGNAKPVLDVWENEGDTSSHAFA